MVDVSYQMVLSTLQTVGLLIGIIYYVMTLRNQQKNQELSLNAQQQAIDTRQTQILLNIYNQGFNNTDFMKYIHIVLFHLQWSSYEEYLDLFDSRNPEKLENSIAMTRLLAFFEGVGVFVRENKLDIKLVAHLMSGIAVMFWEKCQPVVAELRKEYGYPRYGYEAEYLYNELMAYIKENPEIEV